MAGEHARVYAEVPLEMIEVKPDDDRKSAAVLDQLALDFSEINHEEA